MANYYKSGNDYIAVDFSQKDQTKCFVFGRGPKIPGDIASIGETLFEIRRLSGAIRPELVPIEWQEALGLAPVVMPPALPPPASSVPVPPVAWEPIIVQPEEPNYFWFNAACLTIVLIVALTKAFFMV
jgi:hypothetical protein